MNNKKNPHALQKDNLSIRHVSSCMVPDKEWRQIKITIWKLVQNIYTGYQNWYRVMELCLLLFFFKHLSKENSKKKKKKTVHKNWTHQYMFGNMKWFGCQFKQLSHVLISPLSVPWLPQLSMHSKPTAAGWIKSFRGNFIQQPACFVT